MGQNAHSTPATRAGLRNNLGEQGRSSRARKPQLNGEWVTVWERWQATPRTHEAAQRAARTMPAKHSPMGRPWCCQGFRHRERRAPQVGRPKYINARRPPGAKQDPFGPVRPREGCSSAGLPRRAGPQHPARATATPARPTPTADPSHDAGTHRRHPRHPRRLLATPPG